ncbi:MAG: nitroreductase family protein [Eubacteriaceae bacterium]|nr:nitroreductase family protein [Eubacteriaceae bacterium]
MQYDEIIKARYSVRSFTGQVVEDEKLEALFEAARVAPTAANRQPVRILAAKSDEALAAVDEATQCRFGAKLVLIVLGNTETCWFRRFDGAKSNEVDASIVATHMMLKAVELGLGTTWVMHFDPKVISEKFELPANLVPVALLPTGYPSPESKPNDNHFKRINIGELVEYR